MIFMGGYYDTHINYNHRAYFFNSALRIRLARAISNKPIHKVSIKRLVIQMTVIHSGLCPIIEIRLEFPFILAGIKGVADGSFR